jgi:thioredoxin reductase (NADPH)
VKEVLGEEKVSGVVIRDLKTNQEETIALDGLFVAIGHQPNTDFLKGTIDLDSHGYVVVTDDVKSSQEGIFIAGDVADYKYRQAITAAGSGCMAALATIKYLDK